MGQTLSQNKQPFNQNHLRKKNDAVIDIKIVYNVLKLPKYCQTFQVQGLMMNHIFKTRAAFHTKNQGKKSGLIPIFHIFGRFNSSQLYSSEYFLLLVFFLHLYICCLFDIICFHIKYVQMTKTTFF